MLHAGYAFNARLLESVKRQIREFQGPGDDELEAYYRSYSDELERRGARRIEAGKFLETCAGETITVVGDFHTLDQAQKAYLKLVKGLVSMEERPVLLLEMVSANHDGALRKYVNSELEAQDFLEEINYFKHWGFNFYNYDPILKYAGEKGLAVHGLNKEGNLSNRDRFMAAKILHIASHHPGQPVLALVGDLHLAEPHLPAALEKAGIVPLLLFQNSESVYMRKLRRGAPPTGWWSLGSGRYLNNNTPPAIKMQSYLDWLEHGGEAMCIFFGICSLGMNREDDVDLSDTVLTYVRALEDLFALGHKENHDFETYTLKSLDFLRDPFYKKGYGRLLAGLVREGHSLYVEEKRTLFVPLLDVNHTVEEATHYLMHAEFPLGESLPDFTARLHYFACGYLGSKLMNPSRSTPMAAEMRKRLRVKAEALRETEREKLVEERRVFGAALDFFGLVRTGKDKEPGTMDEILCADSDNHFMVSRRIGYIIGETIYDSYDAGGYSGGELGDFVFKERTPFALLDTSEILKRVGHGRR